MYTIQEKKAISELLEGKRQASKSRSDAAFARTIGINPADYSNVTNLKWINEPSLLSNQKWNRIALLVDYKSNGLPQWQHQDTFVYKHVTTLLKASKRTSLSTMLVDDAGIGKSHACVRFAETTENAFYVRCSDNPTTARLVRAIAASMGLKSNKKTEDIIQDIFLYANSVHKPILILDEAGFLKPSAWNTIHRLYNASEFQLSIFVVGSVGLENEIEKGMKRHANGYAEVFSRLGSKYIPVFKDEAVKQRELLRDMKNVIKAQGIKAQDSINNIISKASDMRRIRREVLKIQQL